MQSACFRCGRAVPTGVVGCGACLTASPAALGSLFPSGPRSPLPPTQTGVTIPGVPDGAPRALEATQALAPASFPALAPAPAQPSAPPPEVPRDRGPAWLVALGAALLVGATVAAAVRAAPARWPSRAPPPTVALTTAPTPSVRPTAVRPSPARPEHGALASPGATEGMSAVHWARSALAAGDATGAPDGRFATVRAFVTLQVPPGAHLVSDGTPSPDLQITVDPARPGPYRVEVGVGHDEFVTVADGLSGSRGVDLDAAGVRAGRFVRVRATGPALGLDAVQVRSP
ncbi:MAG: hypothetical protein HY909_29810 [Deltaproteobacteria bacterium]|nr:hypothetical protein [Deltaproteobacteria bacterium]